MAQVVGLGENAFVEGEPGELSIDEACLSMDVDRLDELFGVRLEGRESATVAGLVSELAGRIPQKGEVVEEDGLRFEVLQSTERKVERVRITTVQPRQMKLI